MNLYPYSYTQVVVVRLFLELDKCYSFNVTSIYYIIQKSKKICVTVLVIYQYKQATGV